MAKTARTTKDEAAKATSPLPPADDPQEPQGKPNGVDIPPPDAAKKPSKFARFLVKSGVTMTAGEAASVDVHKPENGAYFRTHPDESMYEPVHCFEQKVGGKRLYLIDPALIVLPEIEGMVKSVLLAPYVTQFGGLGVWPISIEHGEMGWIKSALHICELAKTQWVTAISVKKAQSYRWIVSATDFGEPPWPANLDRDKLLELAFPESDWILDRDHDALKRVRGEK